MRRLVVKNFSCIKSANIELSPLTAIIGPQSSGKSVLLKLIYFFTDFLVSADDLAKEGLSFNQVKKRLLEDFVEWFPISAWGNERFSIEYTLGPFRVRLLRQARQGDLTDSAAIRFSSEFEFFYQDIASLYQKVEKNAESKSTTDEYETLRRFSQVATEAIAKTLGDDFVGNQLFIPAGRSFFTGIGRALLAFEHTGLIDKVTADFGRRYAAARDRSTRRYSARPGSTQYARMFEEILGGKVVLDGSKEFLRAADGRVIPFFALSSGQQELLPLVVVLQTLAPFSGPVVQPTNPSTIRRRIMYIEEPEAHLFPRAQGSLVELMGALVRVRSHMQDLLLTTHSPYVLAKINNLIKAGIVAANRGPVALADIQKVLASRCWLKPNTASAYAIIDGVVTSILDESGLIAADYLDEVSGDIAEEFDQLLTIERKHG